MQATTAAAAAAAAAPFVLVVHFCVCARGVKRGEILHTPTWTHLLTHSPRLTITKTRQREKSKTKNARVLGGRQFEYKREGRKEGVAEREEE
jgi:hypothetical protein